MHQLKSIILSRELTKAIQKHQSGIVVIPGLLDLFDDPNIRQKEAKRIIGRIMKSLDTISDSLLVIASVQESNRYIELITTAKAAASAPIKQIRLTNAKHGRLLTVIELKNNQGDRKSISLSQKELKIVPK